MGVGALSDNNVCIISTDGKTNKQLLSARDGIEKPGSVDYRPMDGTLITGCVVRTLKLKKDLFFEFNAPTIRKDEFSIL